MEIYLLEQNRHIEGAVRGLKKLKGGTGGTALHPFWLLWHRGLCRPTELIRRDSGARNSSPDPNIMGEAKAVRKVFIRWPLIALPTAGP